MHVNHTLGATLIVAGTTIGAGMLALPITASTFGFFNSILLMSVMCVVMVIAALVMLELDLHFGGGRTIVAMSRDVFGRVGQGISTLAVGILFYALLAAYITGATSILQPAAESLMGTAIPFWLVAFSFTIFFGFSIYMSTTFTDVVNRVLFYTMVVVFFVMLGMLLPHVQIQNLTISCENPSYFAWLAMPIFFTSFGFHGCIPSLVTYVGKKPKDLKKMIVWGSFIPLAVYILWEMATLGVVQNAASLMNGDMPVGEFIALVNTKSGNSSLLLTFTHAFSLLAIGTSFLGVGLGHFDFLREQISTPQKSANRLFVALLTFTPPLVFALFYPKGFMLALGYAGVSLCIMAIILPCLIAWRVRGHYAPMTYQVAGGSLTLIALLLTGLGVMTAELGLQNMLILLGLCMMVWIWKSCYQRHCDA